MNCRINFLLGPLLALCTANSAFAEINGASSLEWLSCSTEVIVIGKISKIATTPGPGDVTYEDCTVELKEVIKSALVGKQITFTLRRLGASPTAQPLVKSKEGVLLFLSKSKDHGSEKHLDDKWVPTLSHAPLSIIDLSKQPENIYSKDMIIVGENKELLKIVRDWAKSPVKHWLSAQVPTDSPIFPKLWAGSACFLIVPAEEKFRAHFLKLARSPEPYERAKAAGELGKFPGAETEAMLQELLKDDTESFGHYAQDQISRVTYHVRAAAYHSLKALGKPVPEIPLERNPTSEEQQALRKKCWSNSFTKALKGEWSVSVEDGPTRRFEGRKHTIVIVTCQRDKQEVKFTLVPKYWSAADLPKEEYLGINGVNSQGARRFYLHGKLPPDVKQRVVAYFGLEK